MSTHSEIIAAIESHRRAVAQYDYADEPRQLAGWRLLGMWPQDREGAILFFGYLATLGDELEPGLAQSAAVIADRLKARKVISGREIDRLICAGWNSPISGPGVFFY
jgi:hypothetical protein